MSTSPVPGHESAAPKAKPARKKQKATNPGAARYTCPQCQRSFGRVEHLKRHLGSHTDDRPFKCPTCGKGFLRGDTLQRHEAIHDEGHNRAKPRGARACLECAGAKAKCNNDLPCARCSARALTCNYPADAVAATATPPLPHSHRGSSHFQIQLPPAEQALGVTLPDLSARPDEAELPLPSISSITASGNHPAQTMAPPWDQNSSSPHWLSNGLNPLGDPAKAAPAPVMPFLDLGGGAAVQIDGNVNGNGRPWLDTVTSVPSRHRSQASISAGSDVRCSPHRSSFGGMSRAMPNATPKSHASPHYNCQVASPLRANRANLCFRPMALHQRNAAASTLAGKVNIEGPAYLQIRSVFERLCVATHVPFFSPFASPYFPSMDDFRVLLETFGENAHSVPPILHWPTLDLAACHWTLTLAMAAIGCQMHKGDSAMSNSHAMQELLHRALLMLSETGDTAGEGTDVCCARALHYIGMAYSGDNLLEGRALRLRGALAEYCSTAWKGAKAEFVMPEKVDRDTTEGAWSLWIDHERKRRVGYAIWMLDCMGAYHHLRRPVLGPDDADVPLPCSEMLWEAQTAAHWRQMMESCESTYSTVSGIQPLLDGDWARLSPPGEFSRTLVLHGIYRRAWEVHDYLGQTLTYWTPTTERQALAQVMPGRTRLRELHAYCSWHDALHDSLETFSAATVATRAADEEEHPVAAHLHLSRVILLSPLKSISRFARALTTVEPLDAEQMSNLRADIRQWGLEDQQHARVAIVHAGAHFRHVQRCGADPFHRAHGILLSTLALWAFAVFSDSGSVEKHLQERPSPGEGSPLPKSIELDGAADEGLARSYVRHGGTMAAMMGGVGKLRAADGPRRVLLEGTRLLGDCTIWGSARPAISLLKALSEVPREVVLGHTGL